MRPQRRIARSDKIWLPCEASDWCFATGATRFSASVLNALSFGTWSPNTPGARRALGAPL